MSKMHLILGFLKTPVVRYSTDIHFLNFLSCVIVEFDISLESLGHLTWMLTGATRWLVGKQTVNFLSTH